MYLDLIASDPPTEGDYPTPVPPPELSEGPHLSYAMQWFIFAAAVVVGWVLAVRRSIRTRRNGTEDGNMQELSRSAGESLHISDGEGSDARSGAQETGERSGIAAGETTTE